MLDICRQRTEERASQRVALFTKVISTLCLFHRLSTRPLASWCLNSSWSQSKDVTSLVKSPPTSHRWIFGKCRFGLWHIYFILRESFEVWLQMQRFSEVPEEAIEKMRFSYGRNVAVSAHEKSKNLSHQAASMHLCYSFKPSSFTVCQTSSLN